MTEIPLAIVGTGKMGRAVEELAAAHACRVVARIGSDGNRDGEAISPAALNGAAVALEFSTPAAAPSNLLALARAGCATVSGTTGWTARMPEVRAEFERRGGALLWAANFALGVQAMLAAARAAAPMLFAAGFDVHLVEMHHAVKKDAPSGTAKEIAAALRESSPEDVPVTSVRLGRVPGTHEIVFDGSYEQLRIEHLVRDRRVFADGALRAARWILGRRGVFTLADVLAADGAAAR